MQTDIDMGHRLKQNLRLRSAYRDNSYNTWNVNNAGYLNNNNAYNSYRCAPDCVNKENKRLRATRLSQNLTQGAEIPVRKDEQHRGDVDSSKNLNTINAAEIYG